VAWFVTFYSYKGGVGRTLALTNVAYELARRGRRVVVVDLDLEAPSLSRRPVFSPADPGPGVVDLALTYAETGALPDISDHVRPCPGFEGDGGLWILPAGATAPDYAENLSRLNWFQLHPALGSIPFMAELKEALSGLDGVQPHFVLVDARTGFSELGGLATHQLADEVVLVFHPDEDCLQGTARAYRSMEAANRSERGPLRYISVASRVPPGHDERVRQALQAARELMPAASRQVRIDYDPAMALIDELAVERPDRYPAARQFGRVREYLQRDAPDEVFSTEEQAEVLRGTGQLEEALRVLRAFTEHRPGHAEAHAVLGRFLMEAGRFIEAEAAFRAGCRAAPGLVSVACDLAETLLAQQRPAEALDALNQVADKATAHERLGRLRVRAYTAMDDSDGAQTAQRKLLEAMLRGRREFDTASMPRGDEARDLFIGAMRGVQLPKGLAPAEVWDLLQRSLRLPESLRTQVLEEIVGGGPVVGLAPEVLAFLRTEHDAMVNRFGPELADAVWQRAADLELGHLASLPDRLAAEDHLQEADAALLALAAADNEKEPTVGGPLALQAIALAPDRPWAHEALVDIVIARDIQVTDRLVFERFDRRAAQVGVRWPAVVASAVLAQDTPLGAISSALARLRQADLDRAPTAMTAIAEEMTEVRESASSPHEAQMAAVLQVLAHLASAEQFKPVATDALDRARTLHRALGRFRPVQMEAAEARIAVHQGHLDTAARALRRVLDRLPDVARGMAADPFYSEVLRHDPGLADRLDPS